jgi:hypothetical protein
MFLYRAASNAVAPTDPTLATHRFFLFETRRYRADAQGAEAGFTPHLSAQMLMHPLTEINTSVEVLLKR